MRNKRKLSIFLSIALLLILLISVAGCEVPEEPAVNGEEPVVEEAVRMAINTIGTREDGSWSQKFYEAYQYLKDKYSDVEFVFNDLVAYDEMPQFLRMQAETFQPHVVYMDSAWYEAVRDVAPQYPEIWFVMPEVEEERLEALPENVTTYWTRYEESGYLTGIVAGMITETNQIGYIPGMPGHPNLAALAYAHLEGARSVNPDVEMSVIVTGDWVDVAAGRDAANAAIDAGADVLIHFSDNAGLGVIGAAKERNVYVIGEARDQNELAPDHVVTSYLVPHDIMAEQALVDFMDGVIEQKVVTFGLADGIEMLAPLRNVPNEVIEKVEEVKQDILTGALQPPARYDPRVLDEMM